MKKTKYSIIAAAIFTLAAYGCSDNYDPEFEPVATTRTLALTIDSEAYSNGNLRLGAAPSTTTVKVESNTRWSVEVDCEGGWCDVDAFNGSANGTFSIMVRDNMKEERRCYVKVYMTNAAGEKEPSGSQEITVIQVASDVRITPSSLEPFAAQMPQSKEFEIISNVAWTLSVSYESATATEFISITPLSTAMQPDGDVFKGDGNARFSMSLQDNRTAANRTAFITLKSQVATYTVEIVQLKSEYAFDVSPAEPQIVPARGGTVDFGVMSISGWKVSSSADWISFSPDKGQGSNSRETVSARIAPNTYGSMRSAEIRFTPDSPNYQGLSVTVTQLGYDLTFSMSPTGSLGVLTDEAQQETIYIDSRFDWQLVAPEWIVADATTGGASLTEQMVRLNISRNQGNATRTGTIALYPLPTAMEGGITLDPADSGIEPRYLSVTQFGGQDAAVSIPWLANGYTQTSATVLFNYYSPYYGIVQAGLQWREEDETEWKTISVTPENKVEGTVSIELTGLESAARYVARGFVTDENGKTVYGSATLPFTTAGLRPGPDDNPTPIP